MVTGAVVCAFLASLALTPLAKKIAWKIGAVSDPDGQRKLHKRPTALWGGGAVYLALLLGVVALCFLASDPLSDKLPVALGISAGFLCLLGLYDDLFELRARWKLLGQIVCALPVVAAGCYSTQFTILDVAFDVGIFFGIAWTIGWLVLGINALNLLDGADGLASIIGIAIAIAIGAIAAAEGRPNVMLLAFVLAAALAGFLVHNLPPAQIYLGDCGSMVIGFTLALLALRVSLTPRAPSSTNLTVAVALLFVPLVDTALAIVRRSLRGCNFMVADHSHIHHQILKQGWSVWALLGVLGGFGLTTGAIAWCVAVSGWELLGWIALGSVTGMLASRKLIGYEEWHLTRRFFAQTAVPFLFRLAAARRLARSRPADPTPPPMPASKAPELVIIPARRPFDQTASDRRETKKVA